MIHADTLVGVETARDMARCSFVAAGHLAVVDAISADTVEAALIFDVGSFASLAASGREYAAAVDQLPSTRPAQRRHARLIARFQRAHSRAVDLRERARIAASIAHGAWCLVRAITAATVTSSTLYGPNSTTAARPVMADSAAAHAPPRIGEHPMTCITSPP